MLEQDQAEAVAERIQAEEKAADILKEANDIKAKAKDDKDDFNKRAKAWVEREKVSIGKKHDQADRDRESAAADLLTAQSILDHLRTAYAAVRASLPRIRQVLTWDLATEQEKRQARIDRRQAVSVSPVLRKAIKRGREEGRLSTLEPAPEIHSLDDFGL